MIARLKEYYRETVVPEMMQKFKLKNRMQVPVIEKIVLNVGVGDGKDNSNYLKSVVQEMELITGQKSVITKAKKSIATFKIREGYPVGVKTTLRSAKMYEFFDRLVNIALPRVKDFKGVSPRSFDRFGNFALGIKEQIIFPEINYDKVQKVHGMDVIIQLKNGSAELSREVLALMGMPFRKK